MAGGSSAPELFTSVAGVAVQTDVGVGTIVGSAVFNLLIIIALTTALAGKVLQCDWRPLMRDSFFYLVSISCFIVFAWDAKIDHWEAAILLLLYALYIVLMVVNTNLMNWMESWTICCKKTEVSPSSTEDAMKDVDVEQRNENGNEATITPGTNLNVKTPSLVGGHARRLSVISQQSQPEGQRQFHHDKRNSITAALHNGTEPNGVLKDNEEEQEEEQTMKLCPCNCCPLVRTYFPSNEKAKENGGLEWLKLILRWILWIPAFPFVVMFSWTIPNCSKPHLEKYFIVSFLMSVFWIALLSFAMVTLVSRTGCIIEIDSYVMGLVIIAIGTSIPDALSSVLVARDGFGDMAVSNAIGSNVFDINLGLGLPFLIRIGVDKGKSILLLQSETEWNDYYDGTMKIVPHAKFGFLLIFVLLLALLIFGLAKFRLNKWIGISFVILYVMFVCYAFIQELYCVKKLNTYC